MHLAADEITRLSPPERLELIEKLWDSLEDGDVAVTATQQAELARRAASFNEDRAGTVTWEDFKAELARRSGH